MIQLCTASSVEARRCIPGPCAGEALTAIPAQIQNDMVLLEPSPIGPQ
jgi:hypothetical protein